MAQKILTTFIDDIDGTEADGTVAFALDGAAYEIDLNGKNAAALRKALAVYIEHARKPPHGGAAPRGTRQPRIRTQDTQEVRDWAKSQGIEVKDRGRIPGDVTAKFKAATGGVTHPRGLTL